MTIALHSRKLLEDLPPPPQGREGWPWRGFEATTSAAANYPRITIVTPSFQQGRFLEETIRSVLLQGYPDLEYIIMDGGSTDGSIDIIRKYSGWLSYWKSEPDGGQAAAINEGFGRATGSIFGWLNSDDVLLPGALFTVAEYFRKNPEWQFLYGNARITDGAGQVVARSWWVMPWDQALIITKDLVVQPSAFWKRSVWFEAGDLDTRYTWGFDWEWFIRVGRKTVPQYVPDVLADARVTADTKTVTGGVARRAELAAISRRHGGFLQPTNLVWLSRRVGEVLTGPASWLPEPVRRVVARVVFWPYRRLKAHYRDQCQE